MASKAQVSYGSRGSDVTELQKLLNNNGYNLTVDGIFGANTQKAVKDYQQKNNLAVDGIVGTNTWGSLTATNPATSTPATNATATAPKAPTAPTFEYKESDTVSNAYAELQAQLAQKPGAYQSPWQASLDEALKKIQNREAFSYDFNADALYQQYKDRYIQQGQQAMMDTMGQATALTGGYGNSYAQTAGQQTYQGYLQGLNDKIPELAQIARDTYNQQTQDLYNQFALYGDLENQDYNRYRDEMSDYNAALDRLQNRYDTEREWDYNKYMNDYNVQYQGYRDSVADDKWQKEFDEAKRQYDEAMAFDKQKAGLSGSSGGSSSGSGGSSSGGSSSSGKSSSSSGVGTSKYTTGNGNVSTENIKSLQRELGVTADGIWGEQSAKKAYEKWGVTSVSSAWATYGGYRADDSSTDNVTKSEYGTAYEGLKAHGASAAVAAGLMTEGEFVNRMNRGSSATLGAKSYDEYIQKYIDKYL